MCTFIEKRQLKAVDFHRNRTITQFVFLDTQEGEFIYEAPEAFGNIFSINELSISS